MRTPHGFHRSLNDYSIVNRRVFTGILVVLISVKALSSLSPIIAAFARAAGANVPAVDDDDEKLGDNEDVEAEEEMDEDENHVQDDQIVNKRKRKLQQVVLISSWVTVINWMITIADQ